MLKASFLERNSITFRSHRKPPNNCSFLFFLGHKDCCYNITVSMATLGHFTGFLDYLLVPDPTFVPAAGPSCLQAWPLDRKHWRWLLLCLVYSMLCCKHHHVFYNLLHQFPLRCGEASPSIHLCRTFPEVAPEGRLVQPGSAVGLTAN